MIEERLYQHLLSEVSSVEGRVFANVPEQATAKPCVVFAVDLEAIPDGSNCQMKRKSKIRFQVDIYGKEYFELKTIKNEVLDALASFKPFITDITVEDGYEDLTQLFVQIVKFKI